MRIAAILAASLSLSGCYSIGNREIANPDLVSKIVPGTTTKDGVLELIGEPTTVDFDVGEREKWLYQYTLTKASGRQFIPIFGWLAGPDVEKHSLTVLFDDDGIVKKVAGGESRSRDTFQGAGAPSSKRSGKKTSSPRRVGKRIAGAGR